MAALWGDPPPEPRNLTKWQLDGDYRRRWKTFWSIVFILGVLVGFAALFSRLF